MTTLIDLDALLGEPIPVKLGGREWLLPADIPVPLVLKIEQLAGQDVTDDLVRGLYQDLLELFQVHQPDIESLPITATQALTAIPAIYYGATVGGGGADDAGPPRPKAKAGTKSSSRRKTTRSRS